MINRTTTSISSASRNKKLKINFRDDTKQTSQVTTFAELIKYVFEIAGLPYDPQVPEGVDRKYGCDNWFNFWFEDAAKETYPISNEEDFQMCLKTYENLSSVKIFVVDNHAVRAEFERQIKVGQNPRKPATFPQGMESQQVSHLHI